MASGREDAVGCEEDAAGRSSPVAVAGERERESWGEETVWAGAGAKLEQMGGGV
jgi:hypothetical protein